MKKFVIILAASFFAISIHAQITIEKKQPIQNTTKPLTIKTTPPQTVKSSSTTTQQASQPTEKPLDLFLTDVTVIATKTGTDTYKLQINYTIMNVDTAAISLASFGVQGVAGIEGSGQPLSPACGAVAGLSYQMLNPGARMSGTFYCFNKQFPATGRPVYLLGITGFPGFRIADQTKSGKRVYFTL